MHGLFKADNAWKVTAGSGLGADPARVRVLLPNLALPMVHEFEVEGLRVRLSEAYPGVYTYLQNPVPQDVCKVLPGSYLDLEHLEGAEENNVLLAIEVFGWLLSFYAGREVHPRPRCHPTSGTGCGPMSQARQPWALPRGGLPRLACQE